MKSVVMTAKEYVSAAEVAALTNIYAQKAYYYRRVKGFPESQRGKYLTCDIVRWLRAAGYTVEVV